MSREPFLSLDIRDRDRSDRGLVTGPKKGTQPRAAGTDPPEVVARIQEGLDLVDLNARQFCKRLGHALAKDEIASYGHEGLLHAARSFEAERGVPFRRWANLRVRGAILDGLRSQGDLPRHVHRRLKAIESGDTMQGALLEEQSASPPTTAEDADKRLTTYLAGIATAMALGVVGDARGGDLDAIADRAPTPEESTLRDETARVLGELVDARPDDERTLLRRHYFDGATFEEAAREIGLSKSWASRLHARAVEAIARELKRRG